jgi:hypothetical protein
MKYLPGLSYGAFVPSLYMKSIMARNVNRDARKARAEFAIVADVVIEGVHPGNLGELPPSPVSLLFKARQIGLITDRDPCWRMLNIVGGNGW